MLSPRAACGAAPPLPGGSIKSESPSSRTWLPLGPAHGWTVCPLAGTSVQATGAHGSLVIGGRAAAPPEPQAMPCWAPGHLQGWSSAGGTWSLTPSQVPGRCCTRGPGSFHREGLTHVEEGKGLGGRFTGPLKSMEELGGRQGGSRTSGVLLRSCGRGPSSEVTNRVSPRHKNRTDHP